MEALDGKRSAQPAPGGARWRASLWDYLLIVGWLAVLTMAGIAARAALPSEDGRADPRLVAADAAALIFSVMPVWAYLTVSEARPAHASWGKRRARLRVLTCDGRPLSWQRAAIRNAVKLMPWQLAHVAVVRIILEVDAPVTIAVTYALSVLIAVTSIVMAWGNPLHRALHDHAAATYVASA